MKKFGRRPRITAKRYAATVQQAAVPGRRYLQPAEDRALIIVVGDAEARLQSDVRSELTKQLGAESVNRSAFHAVRPRAELPLETRRYFAGSLVGESENTDALRIEPTLLDEKSNPLDQAERLAGAGAGEHEHWPRKSLDGLALGVRWDVRRVRRDRRSYGDDRV